MLKMPVAWITCLKCLFTCPFTGELFLKNIGSRYVRKRKYSLLKNAKKW